MNVREAVRGMGSDKKFLLVSYNPIFPFGLLNDDRLIIHNEESIPLLRRAIENQMLQSFEALESKDFLGLRRRVNFNTGEITLITRTQTVPVNDLGLVVVYAGQTIVERAINWAKSIRQFNLEAIVWVVACDCEWGTKRAMLSGMDGAGIELIISECGGEMTMGKIAREIQSCINQDEVNNS